MLTEYVVVERSDSLSVYVKLAESAWSINSSVLNIALLSSDSVAVSLITFTSRGFNSLLATSAKYECEYEFSSA